MDELIPGVTTQPAQRQAGQPPTSPEVAGAAPADPGGRAARPGSGFNAVAPPAGRPNPAPMSAQMPGSPSAAPMSTAPQAPESLSSPRRMNGRAGAPARAAAAPRPPVAPPVGAGASPRVSASPTVAPSGARYGAAVAPPHAPAAPPRAPAAPPRAPAAPPRAPAAHSGQPAPGAPSPTHAPVPALAPDVHGADVGIEPDVPGYGPTPEVRTSEAVAAAYTRATTEDEVREDDFSLQGVLQAMLELRGSDLHLTAGAPPTVRVDGSLRPLPDAEPLVAETIQRVMYAITTQQQRERFEETLELDFSYALTGVARFRVNMYRQRDSVGAAFRVIPFEIKSLEALGMPPALGNFASLPRGFVLVTGPTGSGKSTTLAAMVDLANRTRNEHIMTVEDPIEFLHEHKSCLVNQREVGEDTYSFASALKHVLRQDPDIILVGEMRDLETIQVALTAAETGHLVFATLHTQDAAQTIDRVIDVFPPSQQQQIRQQLAGTLQGVVCQTLCKTVDGRGRVAATEVLMATAAIRNLIREGKTHQIYSALQAGASHGMHTLDQHLAELVKGGRITYDVALEKCHHVQDFTRMAGRGR